MAASWTRGDLRDRRPCGPGPAKPGLFPIGGLRAWITPNQTRMQLAGGSPSRRAARPGRCWPSDPRRRAWRRTAKAGAVAPTRRATCWRWPVEAECHHRAGTHRDRSGSILDRSPHAYLSPSVMPTGLEDGPTWVERSLSRLDQRSGVDARSEIQIEQREVQADEAERQPAILDCRHIGGESGCRSQCEE